MATIPWPSASPSVWNTLTLGTVTFPGLAKVKVRGGQKIDRKDGPGADGESTTQQGEKAKDVEISLRIYTEAQWTEIVDQQKFEVLEPVVGKRVPLDIVHPVAAARKVRSVIIEDIDGPNWDPDSRWMEYTLKCLEHKPPKPTKKPVTKKNDTSAANKTPAGDADVQLGRINIASARDAVSSGWNSVRSALGFNG